MRKMGLAGVGLLLTLTVGCGVDDLPDDEAFAACLESAGADPDDLGGAEERREAFAEPAALDCVADLDSSGDREAVLGGVFEDDEQLWPVLEAWIAARDPDQGPEALAQAAGRLLGAADGDDGEDADSGEGLDATVAVALLGQTGGGLPASYQTWHDDPDTHIAGNSTSPLVLYTQYYGWTAEGDYDTWLVIDDLTREVGDFREG